jgi:gamma-glutamylcyclotransferase (GGCT)/AIG2-like uncharacterized protein YtfP
MKVSIFVYGTLKRDQRNHHFLANQEFLREAETLPRYRLYECGWHPALVEDSAHGIAVLGEVWQVSDEVLQHLDEYEGVPDYFSRKPILLQDWDLLVQAYFFNGHVMGLKDCGNCWPPDHSFS